MNSGKTVFSQLMDFLPRFEFNQCVKRHQENYEAKRFSFWDQFLCMAFAQLTYRESLRDIEVCLRSMQTKLYHLGIRGNVSRSTLADANDQRPWQIYADYARVLIDIARELYLDQDLGIELKNTVYALDASTIDLCLSLFPWARFRRRKAAVKLHTLLDLRGSIPTFIAITDGKVHEVNILDELPIEPGAFYIMDRGYLDFARLYRLTQGNSFFVIRAKRNFRFQRLSSAPVDSATGLRCDQTIELKGFYPRKDYPAKLRRVRYWDEKNDKLLSFLTNNFDLPALTIADLYRLRWQVELFFKWIKQHLRIKKFYGTSENAVKTQIWIAVSVYVLVAIVRKKLGLKNSLYTILQILSLSLFEKTELFQALSSERPTFENPEDDNQLILFK